jgi:hypothetical protein
VDIIRERVRSGQLKSGADIRAGCGAAARTVLRTRPERCTAAHAG